MPRITTRIITLLALAALTLAACAQPTPAGTSPVGNWQLATLNGQPPVADSSVTLTLATDGTASGNSGCNQYSGEYTFDPASNTLTTFPLASTLIACADDAVNAQKSTYLAAISATPFTVSVTAGQLTLTNAADDTLTFTAIP